MEKRTWTAEQKFQIVIQGLKDRSVAELCNEHQIGQSQDYAWRDQFLANGKQAFETRERTPKEQ